MCVLILLCRCPHTVASYVFAYCLVLRTSARLDTDSAYIRQLHMCPHPAIHASSYCCICVGILRDAAHSSALGTATYCYLCVRILLYVSLSCYIYMCSGAAHSRVAPIVPRRIRMLTYADACWRAQVLRTRASRR